MHRRQGVFLCVLAFASLIGGTPQFMYPDQFARIVPPPFPPLPAVYISGFFESLGGIGLLIPLVSVAAAWGLLALFIAVYPANIYMTLHNIQVDGIPQSQALYLARLPLQFILIAWAYWYTRNPQTQLGSTKAATKV